MGGEKYYTSSTVTIGGSSEWKHCFGAGHHWPLGFFGYFRCLFVSLMHKFYRIVCIVYIHFYAYISLTKNSFLQKIFIDTYYLFSFN